MGAAIGGSGLAMLDSTVVNVAPRRLCQALGPTCGVAVGDQWIHAVAGALILLGGALGDRHGRRPVFLVALTATVVRAADEHRAGIASAINNAVARSTGR